MRRNRLALACVALGAADALMFALLAIMVVSSSIARPAQAEVGFVQSVKDRPVLESVQQVWQAQATGVSEFDFDGVHYVIEVLPRDYVAYSSWYCRMP